jgi:D-amino-acid dehydrogenase
MRVIVLGAGVIGVTSAYWLLREGFEVEVVERQPAAGLETSWGNGAIVHASSVEPWAAPGVPLQVLRWLGDETAPMLLRPRALPQMWRWGLGFLRNCSSRRFSANRLANLELALESVAAFAEIRAATRIAYDHAPDSVLKVYADQASLDAATAAHRALAPYGLVTERLEREACLAREPALALAAAPIAGGLLFPQDELGDCSKFSQGLAAWCAERGARFHYGTRVEALLQSEGRVVGALTDRGDITADAVVVALGSWTPRLLAPLGIPVPIYPVKGVSVTLPRRLWPEAPRMAILNDALHFALVPIGDRLRAVGSAEITGYDASPDPARIRAIVEAVARLFPQFRDCAASPEAVPWAGLRPVTPSGRPIIGRGPVPGLFINSGHGHTGWTLSAGSGKRLAAMVREAGQEAAGGGAGFQDAA